MEQKYVLITGASGGIGRSIAQKLAADGYSLYLHYNKNEQAIMEMMSELASSNVELIPIQADLSSKDGYRKLAENIFSLDAIVLNSGSSAYGLITDMEEELVEAMVQLHVTSPFLIGKMLLPKLMNKKHASIVAITSIWGQTGASYEVLYSMVKGAQNAFVKALSKELAPSRIRVNGIAPGAISTPMMEEFSPEDLQHLQAEIPMGRMGLPHEIAETTAFLLSEKASYITGQIIGVNGGWYT
ncbi:3-oxoacyl-[acyl-carrier protein] reductase [Peribacillus deserti]|uniref:3-oxoacyl-[acyl-carrier protein] reductase n=1 Tax=Peribacillus deserti TaxID=673318 RepID=A0ABS2QQN5_9BACI|nr:SDR family oxidoreductase [Peribacillus deserti]MBM7694763.1 3-oxoacyl-[acyl-carrier protein] reductase [Peribacillus deserti]